jgi:AraC-like DNA-binding protein
MLQPLQPQVCVRTRNPRELESVLSASLRPAQIRPGAREGHGFLFQHLRLDHSCISLLEGNSAIDVTLNVDRARPAAYIFWMQLDGSCWMSPDGRSLFEIPVFHGCIASSGLPGTIRQDTHTRQFFVRFDRTALAPHLEECGTYLDTLDRGAPIRLPSLLGSALQRYIGYLLLEFRQTDSPAWTPRLAGHTEQMLMALLADALRRCDTGGCGGAPAPWEPRYVTKAVRYLLDNLDREITVADLVSETGVSLRTLYRGFRLYRGCSPMAFLRERRLERVHAELAQADPRTTSVTDIALRAGFNHLSNFASLYRNRYGRLPSDTLAKKPT